MAETVERETRTAVEQIARHTAVRTEDADVNLPCRIETVAGSIAGTVVDLSSGGAATAGTPSVNFTVVAADADRIHTIRSQARISAIASFSRQSCSNISISRPIASRIDIMPTNFRP